MSTFFHSISDTPAIPQRLKRGRVEVAEKGITGGIERRYYALVFNFNYTHCTQHSLLAFSSFTKL